MVPEDELAHPGDLSVNSVVGISDAFAMSVEARRRAITSASFSLRSIRESVRTKELVVRLIGDDRLALTMATAAERERQLQRALGECALSRSWIFTLGGCLIAIPVGIKRKSLGPLVFYGTTGAMVDIIQGISLCEKEREELKAFMEEKKAAKQGGADGAGSVSGSESKEGSGVPQDIAQTLGDDGGSR
ncbi:unnamed protein product [Closterium sp. Yama58-4]|nr:unnamed protein product [Closterium sp. Yama58-4]